MKIFIVFCINSLCIETVHFNIMRQKSFGSLCITVNSNISEVMEAPNSQPEGL